MFNDYEYIKQFTDIISEGVIFIDNKGIIQVYNKKAKEIFGVIYNQGNGHPAGKISKEDIVIIADNALGKDDGGLKPSDLKVIGIQEDAIDYGDGFVAVGVYNSEGVKPVYRVLKEGEKVLRWEGSFLGNNILVSIDFEGKLMNISVNDDVFEIEYFNSFGHMVVISGETNNIKFYQAKGYTIRKESIYDILTGKEFIEKGNNSTPINVIGKEIFEVHGFVPDILEFRYVAQGKNLTYRDKYIEINGRPTLCTLIPIDIKGKRKGALLKIKDISELRQLVQERDEALIKLEEMQKALKEKNDDEKLFPEIIGESNSIKNTKKLLNKAAKSNSTVLLLGESGTGKGLMAKAIHGASRLKNMPFIHVNCASIPENLLESELFGYEGGAFTGAKEKGKIGFFEMAEGGTIFLDEIAEIPISMQSKLLQVLQNKSFYRVGGTKEIKVNVRIICATNKNLEKEVLKGRFREDLFYRINVFPVWIPPLRDRRDDIIPLTKAILPKICTRLGYDIKHISGEALQKLTNYDWPGNVRQLENVIERAANLCEGSTILSNHLQIEGETGINEEIKPLREIVAEAERKAIEKALKEFQGDRQKAIKALGIGKTSFYDKLKKYNL